MSKSRNKKLVAISEDVLAQAIEASVKANSSPNKFIEDALKLAVQMNSLGVTSNELENLCELSRSYKLLGGDFVPLDVLTYLTHKAYDEDKETFLSKWYDSGVWYGKYIKEKFNDPVEGFREFLLATCWSLSEVNVTFHKDFIKLICVSSVLSLEDTESLVKFIDGVMHGMRYQTNKTDYCKGIIAMEFNY